MPLHWTHGLAALGAATTGLGAWLWIRRARFERRALRATGTVVEVAARSSDEYPVVRFAPAKGPEVQVETAFAVRPGTYQVGQQVPVAYDPGDPRVASLETEDERYQRATTSKVLLAVGLLVAVVGAGLGAFIPGIEADSDARDRALRAFITLVRKGDLAAVRRAAGPGAKLDEDFLQRYVRPSTGTRQGNSVIGFDDTSCVDVALLPSGVQLVVKLVKTRAGWKVTRAGSSVPECTDRLDD